MSKELRVKEIPVPFAYRETAIRAIGKALASFMDTDLVAKYVDRLMSEGKFRNIPENSYDCTADLTILQDAMKAEFCDEVGIIIARDLLADPTAFDPLSLIFAICSAAWAGAIMDGSMDGDARIPMIAVQENVSSWCPDWAPDQVKQRMEDTIIVDPDAKAWRREDEHGNEVATSAAPETLPGGTMRQCDRGSMCTQETTKPQETPGGIPGDTFNSTATEYHMPDPDPDPDNE